MAGGAQGTLEGALQIWGDTSIDMDVRTAAVIPHLHDLPVQIALQVYLACFAAWLSGWYEDAIPSSSYRMAAELDDGTYLHAVTLHEFGEAGTDNYQLFRATAFAFTFLEDGKLAHIRALNLPEERPRSEEKLVVRSTIIAGGFVSHIYHADFHLEECLTISKGETYSATNTLRQIPSSPYVGVTSTVCVNRETADEVLNLVATGSISGDAFLREWFSVYDWLPFDLIQIFKFLSALQLMIPDFVIPSDMVKLLHFKLHHTDTNSANLVHLYGQLQAAPPELWKASFIAALNANMVNEASSWSTLRAVSETILNETPPCFSINNNSGIECLYEHHCGEPPGAPYSTGVKRWSLGQIALHLLKQPYGFHLAEEVVRQAAHLDPGFHAEFLEGVSPQYTLFVLDNAWSGSSEPFTHATLRADADKVEKERKI